MGRIMLYRCPSVFHVLHCSSSAECQNNMDICGLLHVSISTQTKLREMNDSCASVILIYLSSFTGCLYELNIPYIALSLSVVLLLMYWKLNFYECQRNV